MFEPFNHDSQVSLQALQHDRLILDQARTGKGQALLQIGDLPPGVKYAQAIQQLVQKFAM